MDEKNADEVNTKITKRKNKRSKRIMFVDSN